MSQVVIFVHLCLITGVVVTLVHRQGVTGKTKLHGYASFILKALGGLGLGYFYWVIKGSGDTLFYHYEAIRIAEWGRVEISTYLSYLAGVGQLPFKSVFEYAPRAEWISKLASVIYIFGPAPYWLSATYFSLFAWIGAWKLTTELIRVNASWKNSIYLSLLYFPSVVFWASGLTKESIAIGAITWMIALIVSLRNKSTRFNTAAKWTLIVLLFYMLWQVKYYYAAVFCFSILVGTFVYLVRRKKPRLVWGIIILFTIPALWYTLSLFNPNLEASYIPEVVYDQYAAFVDKSEPGKYIEFGTLCPEWGCVALTFPYAVLAGIYLPLPFEAWGIFSLLAGLENLILIVLTLSYLVNLFVDKVKIKWSWIYLAGWTYCILLAGFLALSAPNIGTLIRYRSGFLPIFILLITLNNGYFYSWLNKILPTKKNARQAI